MTRNAATDPFSAYFASIGEAFENAQAKFEVPAVARDFAKRSTETAKECAQDARANAFRLTDGAERFAGSVAGAYAGATREILDATFANIEHALATVAKAAEAKTPNEALKLHADFARESATANFERARSAAETARDTLVEGAKTAQAEFAKFHSFGKKAA